MVKRAQAASQKATAYTAAVASPRCTLSVVMGSRSRSPKESHQWVSSQGCSQSSWEIESRMNIITFTSTIAMVAPIGCSVRVGEQPDRTEGWEYRQVANRQPSRRSRRRGGLGARRGVCVAATEERQALDRTDDRDSRVAPGEDHGAAYLVSGSQVRPAGTVSRRRRVRVGFAGDRVAESLLTASGRKAAARRPGGERDESVADDR